MGLLTEPEAEFDYTIGGLEIQLNNLSQNVYPDSIDGGHYLWKLEGETVSNDESPIFELPESGAYNVELVAVVCSDTSRQLQCISLDGSECADLTGLSNVGILELHLSPNPATDQLRVSIPHQSTALSYQVLDVQGKQSIASGKLAKNAPSLNLDVSHYPVGLYLFQLMSVDGEILAVSRFVISD